MLKTNSAFASIISDILLEFSITPDQNYYSFIIYYMQLPKLQKIIRLKGEFQISDLIESDFKNKITILYFYPKDDTPGCTIESCGFRDLDNLLDHNKFQIIGSSRNDLNSHKKFIIKHDLNFALISDTDLELAKLFKVAKEKSMFSRKFMTNERSTFVLSSDGDTIKEFRNVNPITHLAEIKKYLSALN